MIAHSQSVLQSIVAGYCFVPAVGAFGAQPTKLCEGGNAWRGLPRPDLGSLALACAPDGSVWHSFNNYLRFMRSEGDKYHETQRAFLKPAHYLGIAFDVRRGEAFVLCPKFCSIFVLTLEGTVIRQFGVLLIRNSRW